MLSFHKSTVLSSYHSHIKHDFRLSDLYVIEDNNLIQFYDTSWFSPSFRGTIKQPSPSIAAVGSGNFLNYCHNPSVLNAILPDHF